MVWLIALILFALPAAAFDVPPVKAFVTDRANVLPDDRERRLEETLRGVAKSRGIEIAVLTVPDIAGETIESAAQKVFDAWKMGHKGSDRGALFLVAPTERKVRIQVGYGLEGELPDGKIGALIDQHVLARFRQGNVAGGVEAGVQALLAELGVAAPPPVPRSRRPRPQADPIHTAIFIGFLALLALGSAVSPGFRHLLWDVLFWMMIFGRGGGGQRGSGGDDGGGFGGFGGGSSGGGGASRGW